MFWLRNRQRQYWQAKTEATPAGADDMGALLHAAGASVRHAGDAYDKKFGSWDHLVALVYAQLGGIERLRALEAAWNANAHHHSHPGVGPLARSTLADANARRPLAIFAETFAKLSGLADRLVRREGEEMLRLIDAPPIPLGKAVEWAKRNGRIRGLKMHVVYDPVGDTPTFGDIPNPTAPHTQFSTPPHLPPHP